MVYQGGLAVLGAFFLFFFIIGLAVYIYVALALMSMAKKTGTPNGWLGFIPIANIYLMTAIAGIPWWWLIVSFLPFIGLFAVIYIWWKMAERLSRPGWWAILLLIPVVNIIIMGMMAWGSGSVAQPAMGQQMPPQQQAYPPQR